MGVHWEVVGGLLGVSKGYKNHGLIGPGGYWRGLKVFLWNSLMFLTLKIQIVYLYRLIILRKSVLFNISSKNVAELSCRISIQIL